MSRLKSAPYGFRCPYENACPHLQGLSANWLLKRYWESGGDEDKYWKLRGEMMMEMRSLEIRIQEQEREIEQLRAENRRLHQRGFKPSKSAGQRASTATTGKPVSPVTRKPRGAPKGHPPWNRKAPEHIDHHYHIWYAGNESLAVLRIDAHCSSEAAIELLGKKIEGLLVTDAYASYNAIECGLRLHPP